MDMIYRGLRAAIKNSDTTRYRLAKMTGVSQSQLAQFMLRRKGMSVETIELLANALELEIVFSPKARKGKKRK